MKATGHVKKMYVLKKVLGEKAGMTARGCELATKKETENRDDSSLGIFATPFNMPQSRYRMTKHPLEHPLEYLCGDLS